MGGFLGSVFSFIIKLVFWLLGIIASIVIYPLQALIVTAFPSLGWALTEILNYCVNDLFPMISFIKDVFLGITCCPPALWNALIGLLAFRVAAVPAVRFILTAINIWKIKSGNINLK